MTSVIQGFGSNSYNLNDFGFNVDDPLTGMRSGNNSPPLGRDKQVEEFEQLMRDRNALRERNAFELDIEDLLRIPVTPANQNQNQNQNQNSPSLETENISGRGRRLRGIRR